MMVGGLAALALATPAMAAAWTGSAGRDRRFTARSVNTGERCDALWIRAGRLCPQGCAEVDHFFRDWRTGDARAIDPGLLALLGDVRELVGGAGPIELVSGYRSARTNAARHAHSHGVASNSQHIAGRAADIRIPGVSVARIAAAGRAHARGGVGYYPTDGFVHLDTGPVRTWTG